jgi:RNA-directed DNA polymerase
MRVLYIEGVATHDGPESCAGVREGVGEALAGVVRAGLLSRESSWFGVPTLSQKAEGHVCGGAIASRRGTPRGQRAWARSEISMRENREVQRSPGLVVDAPSWMVRGVVCRPVAGREGNAEAVRP